MCKANPRTPVGDSLRLWVAISIILATLIWADVSAQAASRYVPTQYATIQDAIDSCSDGDTVIVADGTYTGFGNRDIDVMGKAITVCSQNGPENCIIDCQGTETEPHRAFYFHRSEDGNSIVSGFTITNGYAPTEQTEIGARSIGGGILCFNGSSPKIALNVITNNTTGRHGAGVCCWGSSSANIEENIIRENEAPVYGGGIFCYQSSPLIRRNKVSDNTSDDGGGGICCYASSAILEDNTIMHNEGGGYGGGILCYGGGEPIIRSNVISGNQVVAWGGGIYCACSAIVADNEIAANAAEIGGGIACYECSPVIKNNTIALNRARNHGGGIDCDGPGQYYDPWLTIINNVVTSNRATNYGGGICCNESYTSMANNTISNNVAYSGGGIYYHSYLTIEVDNCVIWGNTANIGPQMSVYYYGNLSIRYSNLQGSLQAAYVEQGSRLLWGLGNIDADPELLSDGYHLSPSSPCINTGDPSADYTGQTDIDGEPRVIYGRVDIGADEYSGVPIGVISSLNSTQNIFSQIKGGFGKLPSEWERDFQGPIPDTDSPAGNAIFTSPNGLESITDAGDLPGRPVPVLAEGSLLGNGQPRGVDYVSIVPVVGMIHDWYTWVTNLRGMQSHPAPEDLRERSLSTGVNGNIRLVDFIGRDHIDLDVHFEFFGWAAGYGVGPETALVTNGLMSAVTSLSNPLKNLFEKTVNKIGLKFGEYCLAEDAVGYDARFRAKAEAAICFGDPINKCFDCPAITPDGTQSYLWQGGGVYEISSGPVWQGVDFQVIVPTNQNIPLLLELVTSVETAGWAHGGAEILHYKAKFTCPEIPDFGTYVIDSLGYRSLGSLKAMDVTEQVTANKLFHSERREESLASPIALFLQGDGSNIVSESSKSHSISFGPVLVAAAGSKYLKTGLVSVRESLCGIEPNQGHPFVFVEGMEQSGVIFPIKIPRRPKKLVLLFNMVANRPVISADPVNVEFGLINTERISLVERIDPSPLAYKPVPDPNGSYSLHTGWQEIVVDISDIPSGEMMFCIAVDSNQAPINFGLAQSDLLIITDPALPGDFDADRIVNFADYGMLASYWLEENCSYPDWCGWTDLDFTGRIGFAELGTIGSNWLRERIIGDFEPDGDVDFSDFMELGNYWLSSESSLDILPAGGDGKINFRDFAQLADHWLERTTP